VVVLCAVGGRHILKLCLIQSSLIWDAR
jgi:hypothetical protein